MKYLYNALLFLLFTPCIAGPSLYGPYIAHVVKVIDGDTVRVEVAIWLDQTVQVNLRLAGVDTPEKRGAVSACEKEAGQKATNFTQNWLRGIETVWIHEVRPDKYAGRALGKLYIPDKGDLSEALIAAGLAAPYQGGKRAPWCD